MTDDLTRASTALQTKAAEGYIPGFLSDRDADVLAQAVLDSLALNGPDRDQGTGAVGLLLDTATLKTVEAVEGVSYRWDGTHGWLETTT